MKKFSIAKLLLILFLSMALILTGCGVKEENIEDTINYENEMEDKDIGLDEDDGEDKGREEDGLNEEAVEEEDEDLDGDTEDKKDIAKPEETKKEEKEEEEKEEDKEQERVEETKNILKVEGKVGKELRLSLDKLKSMNNLIFKGEFFSINNFGTQSYTEFKGVNLWKLLEEEAEISSDATSIAIIAIDGYEMEFTVEQIKRQDYIDETNPDARFPVIIAWEEEGEEYDWEEAPPYKLIIGQKEPGDVNKPQWVSKIDKILVK